MFLPTALPTWFVAHRWERLRGRPWAMAVERALAAVPIGLMAAGVYTVARSAVMDGSRRSSRPGRGSAKRWLPSAAAVLAAGALGWLLGL